MDFVIMDEAHIVAGGVGRYAAMIEDKLQTREQMLLGLSRRDGWTKKRKGNAKIYTHPSVERAIVENHWGVTFNGVKYPSVELAKVAALGGAA